MSELPTLQSPDCPYCGYPPVILLYEQAFCGNDDCKVILWNPRLTPAENLADAGTVDWQLSEGDPR